jgi:hypothetical protein
MDDAGVVARFALKEMSAQCRCATQGQFRQCALHMRRSLRRPAANELARVLFQDVGDSESLSSDNVDSSSERQRASAGAATQPGTCRTGSQSIGLGVDPR